jgi:uncharacterized protein YcbK (DUF882 family)
MRWIVLVAAALALLLAVSTAAAKPNAVLYKIRRGDTLSSIAAHFRVSVASICRWNAIKKDALLVPGRRIGVPLPPGFKPPASVVPNAASVPTKSWHEFARKPARPGWVTLKSYAGEWEGQLVGADGRLLREALGRVTQLLAPRRKGGKPTIDPRLLGLIAQVSDTFGGRWLQVVSGYRPGRRSRHSYGQAVDFRIAGVPNEAVRDYLLTLNRRIGVGYYPNSTHVHMDVRDQKTYWIDVSRPGQRPRYMKRPVHALGRVANSDRFRLAALGPSKKSLPTVRRSSCR